MGWVLHRVRKSTQALREVSVEKISLSTVQDSLPDLIIKNLYKYTQLASPK